MNSSPTYPSTVVKQWQMIVQGKSYEVSTDKSLLDRNFINNAYSSTEMFWIHAMPPQDLEALIANSVMVGLYDVTSARTMLGMARLVTDQLTFAFMTDVYVLPESRGLGLARWITRCAKEVCMGFPHLYRVLLLVDLKVSDNVVIHLERLSATHHMANLCRHEGQFSCMSKNLGWRLA